MSEEKDVTAEETTDEVPAPPESARRRVDPRARHAQEDERTLLQRLGMPALGVGLIALIFGLVWGRLERDLLDWGPGIITAAGFLLTGFGIVYGVPSFLKQLHGRGSLVVLVSLGMCVAVLVLLVGVNAVGLAFATRIDNTTNHYYALSEQSRDILGKVPEDVTITVLAEQHPIMPPSYDATQLRRLLREYDAASKYITWKEVDLIRHPELKEQYDVSFGNRAIIESGERREEVTLAQNNEEGLTAAIYRVSKPDKDAIYYLTGHSELTLEEFGGGENSASSIRQALDNVQMDVRKLSLAAGEEDPAIADIEIDIDNQGDTESVALDDVPEDASAVMVLGAQVPLAQGEMDTLKRYVDEERGGLFIALAFEEGAPDFSEILSEYGVHPQPGVILDPAYREAAIPVAERPTGHDVVSNITQLWFPMCKPLDIEQDQPQPDPYGGPPPQPSSDAKPLGSSSQAAWVQVDLQGQISQQSGTGPHNMAVVIDTAGAPPTPPGMPPPPADEGGARIVVVGSYMMLADSYTRGAPSGTNIEFVTQSLSWLAGVGAISIPPKEAYQFSLHYGKAANVLVAVVLLLVIPFGTLFTGIIIWWTRR